MKQRPVQKSRTRAVWSPLQKEYYRSTPATTKLSHPIMPKRLWNHIKFSGNNFRMAPLVLSVDTKRWYQRCPEQINLTIKSYLGSCQLELTNSIRRPPNCKAYCHSKEREINVYDKYDDYDKSRDRWYRRPDFFVQHTQPWRYCLDNPQHVRAFQHLLTYSMAYVSGYDSGVRSQGAFKHIYWPDVGERKELARWPINGLTSPDGDYQQLLEGYEVLEVIGLPGERPRRPKSICGPRPLEAKEAARYDAVEQHWHKQLKACNTRRIELRLRRVTKEGNDAYFFHPTNELDLSLDALRSIQRNLPGFWKRIYEHYLIEGNQQWPREPVDDKPKKGATEEGDTVLSKRVEGDRKFVKYVPEAYASPWEWEHYYYTVDAKGKRVPRRRELLGAMLTDQRQFRWSPELWQQHLTPGHIAELCSADPQHGIWLDNWTDQIDTSSKDYRRRLMLWAKGLLRWDSEWSVSAEEATEDYKQLQLDNVNTIVQTFLLQYCLKRYRKPRQRVHFKEPLKLVSWVNPYRPSARAPPLVQIPR